MMPSFYARPRSDASSGAQYLDRVDGEIWHGRRWSLSEKSRLLGIETRPLEELSSAVASPVGVRRVLRGYDAGVDAAVLVPDDGRRRSRRDSAWHQVLSELRLVKDEWEIAQLQDAIDATVRGFEDVARILPADRAVAERLIEGVFGLRARARRQRRRLQLDRRRRRARDDPALDPQHRRTTPGELLLMDMGVENRNLYTADVTRMCRSRGTFTPLQRQVYDIVHASQQAGMDAIRPGVKFRDVHQACMRVLAEGLHDLGLLPVSVDEAMDKESMVYRRWTLHGFGHMLGLDVHDCAPPARRRTATARCGEGYVLTVEPGLYFQPEDELVPAELRGIGVRIEDDVWSPPTAAANLSAGLPRTADEVETWLAAQREAGPRDPLDTNP